MDLSKLVPRAIAAAIGSKEKPEHHEPRPIPEAARKAYAHLRRVSDRYEIAAREYQLHDARMDHAKAELIHALRQADPEAARRDVELGDDGTYRLERKPA